MYRMCTGDSSFLGSLEECMKWFESDSFSPKVTAKAWFDLTFEGSHNFGFPWGVVTLKKEVTK